MSIVEGLKNSVASSPEKIASVCGSTRLTFREMDERVNRLSSALAGLGIARGDRVAILSLNCHRFFELYYGVPQLGAVVVPINFRLTPQEIKYIVDHSGAKALAVDPELAPLIENVRSSLQGVEHFILMSGEPREGYLTYDELLAGGSPEFDAPELGDEELLGLFYTSGTTAEPKGVMLTHNNMLANIRHSQGVYNYLPTDVYL